MTDRSVVDRLLLANRYLMLGAADADGQPWVTPVFFAPHEPDRVCWVSSPDSRHSRKPRFPGGTRHHGLRLHRRGVTMPRGAQSTLFDRKPRVPPWLRLDTNRLCANNLARVAGAKETT